MTATTHAWHTLADAPHRILARVLLPSEGYCDRHPVAGNEWLEATERYLAAWKVTPGRCDVCGACGVLETFLTIGGDRPAFLVCGACVAASGSRMQGQRVWQLRRMDEKWVVRAENWADKHSQ